MNANVASMTANVHACRQKEDFADKYCELPEQAASSLRRSSSERSPVFQQQHLQQHQIRHSQLETRLNSSPDIWRHSSPVPQQLLFPGHSEDGGNAEWRQPDPYFGRVANSGSLRISEQPGSSGDASWRIGSLTGSLTAQLLDGFPLPVEVAETGALELLDGFPTGQNGGD